MDGGAEGDYYVILIPRANLLGKFEITGEIRRSVTKILRNSQLYC